MWMWSTGINRNIVECKAYLRALSITKRFSINRNIVECKGNLTMCGAVVERVLIETLWNVKSNHISILVLVSVSY